MTGPEQGPEVGPVIKREREAGPRIYVASLSDYNAGILHGTWLRAGDGVTALWEGIEEMLAKSPVSRRYGDVAEEWRIDDYEGWGRHVTIDSFDDLERIEALAQGLEAHGEAFGAWHRVRDAVDVDDVERFDDHYLGEFSSLEEWAEDQLESIGFDIDSVEGIPENLRPYIKIDVEGWARDAVLGGDITTVESDRGVYVFWNY